MASLDDCFLPSYFPSVFPLGNPSQTRGCGSRPIFFGVDKAIRGFFFKTGKLLRSQEELRVQLRDLRAEEVRFAVASLKGLGNMFQIKSSVRLKEILVEVVVSAACFFLLNRSI